MGQNLPGMLDEHTQEVVLLGRELDLLIANRHDPAHQVDREIPIRNSGRSPLLWICWRWAARMRASSSFIPNGLVT